MDMALTQHRRYLHAAASSPLRKLRHNDAANKLLSNQQARIAASIKHHSISVAWQKKRRVENNGVIISSAVA